MTADRNARTSLELLWGEQTPPSRGPKPGLSVPKIVATAVRIADSDGLEALSMQRVAGALGYTAMSLYRYVPGKEQLIDLSYDHALGRPPKPGDGDWRTEVDRWVRAVLAVYQRHPWLLRIRLNSPPLGPNQLAWFDALLRQVATVGLADDEMVHLVMFVSGAVRELARISTELDNTGVSVDEMGEGYALAMKRLADGTRFHALSKVVAAGTFEPDGTPYHDVLPSLEFGLARLLDGVQSYLR